MSVDPVTLGIIVAMAALTYLTRIAGIVAARFAARARSGRAAAAFEALPPAVFVSIIAPTVLLSGWPEAAAAAVTALASTRLPMLAAIAAGIGAVIAFRYAATALA